MSKAFLPEDTAAEQGPLLPPRSSEPLPITPGGHRRLTEERASLVPGDEATRTRALVLDRILASVEVVAPALLEGGAGFGCTVEVRDERGGRRSYVLVGPDEVEPAAGRISAESPIGRRLLRAKVGDVIEVERGGRAEELEVLEVRAGDE